MCFRAVGTFARALDCSSSIRQPSLHMSAAAASRDITLVKRFWIWKYCKGKKWFLSRGLRFICLQFHAMDTLQKNNYDLASAMSTLVPQGGPVLCRDEMEEWSASEAMLFEEALEKYGKDFTDIRQDFVSAGAVVGMEILGMVKLTRSCNQWYNLTASSPSVAMEVFSECGPVLLHVEDDRPLHPTGWFCVGAWSPWKSLIFLILKPFSLCRNGWRQQKQTASWSKSTSPHSAY